MPDRLPVSTEGGKLSEIKNSLKSARRNRQDVEYAYMHLLLDCVESVKGDVYLWRIGEINAEKAMEGVRDSLAELEGIRCK